MRMAVARGRGARPDLKIGICGEHGGEPSSVAFCDTLGLNYVSCSPYRVPIAAFRRRRRRSPSTRARVESPRIERRGRARRPFACG